MQISSSARSLLIHLFTLSSGRGPLTRPRLERQSGLSGAALNVALAELAQRGLVDVQRLRLTLPGLALAAACRARPRTQPRPAANPARQRRSVNLPIALFSEREMPLAVA